MKFRLMIILAAMLAASGCSVAGPESDSAQAAKESSAAQSALNTSDSTPAGSSDENSKAEITLNGSSASLDKDNSSVSINGSTVKITSAGEYTLKGSLDDGCIIVEAPKTDKVDIYLDGVSVKNSKSAPLRVEVCGGCTVHLVEGSVNTFSDSSSNEFSACISSKDDLTIKGSGTLNVTGSAKHAIKSSNDLRIKNGTLVLNAVSAALFGEDSVEITGGNITVENCKDGIKSEDGDTIGSVTIEEANVDIKNASGNGIEASVSVTVKSGSVRIHSLKTPVNCKSQTLADGTVRKY